MMIIKNIKIACVYIGYLNTLKSIRGSFKFNCLIENKTIPMIPTIIGINTLILKNPDSLFQALLKPYITAPKPIVEKTNDK